ncbi:NAD(P)/FAD-dependent oxidoreductase [bacterium]|nr:NAD(P)/FAD-dependent oxidoreductase [bacterium]
MADYDVIVIGAGNGGLMAAARLAKKGVRVLVLERHNIPGGCATSFCRGRFEFEVALHQLSGLGTEAYQGPLWRMLSSVDVIDKLDFVTMNDLYRLQLSGSDLDITLRPDRNQLVSDLQQAFPHEKEAIQKYIDFSYAYFMEAVSAYYMQDPDAGPEKYPLYFKYALKSAQAVLDEYFTDPRLKFAISPYWSYIGLPPRLMSFHDLTSVIVGYCEFKPTHIKGGSQALSNAVADTILQHGGTIRYSDGVRKILVREGAVQGVITEKGEEITSRVVISNASKISTFVDMMDPEHVPAEVSREMRQTTIAQGAFTLYMGLDCPPETVDIRETTNFVFGIDDYDRSYQQMKNLEITRDDMLLMSCYNLIDPGFSPEGTSQVAVVTLKYGDTWLQVPPAQYVAKKYECADAILTRLAEFYPHLRDHIEEIEIATPITSMRYLGTQKGSIYAFDHLIKDSDLFIRNQTHIKGLHGVGGWFGMIGFQPTLTSGVVAAKTVIKELN